MYMIRTVSPLPACLLAEMADNITQGMRNLTLVSSRSGSIVSTISHAAMYDDAKMQ